MINKIAIHHSGGLGKNNSASTQHLRAGHVNNAHRSRWNYISQLGKYGGYNFFIDEIGSITQFRAIGEETMAQIGHNFDTVSICLAGNFNKGIDKPTKNQIQSFKNIMISLMEGKHNWKVAPDTKISIGWGSVYPHRVLQKNGTQCCGTSIPDNWGRMFVIDYLSTKLGIMKSILQAYVALLSVYQSKKPTDLLGARMTEDNVCGGF